MGTFAINFSIITGWFPLTVIIVALASVVLSVGWVDGAWKWQLPLGIPISFVLTVLTALAIHYFKLVPDQFPRTFYLWAWLIWYSVVVFILGWTRAHWLLRTFSVIAVVFSVIAAFTVINQTYDYYPTLARLFGKNAANFTDLPGLQQIRDQARRTGKLPDHGSTIIVTIPPTKSKFQTGQAYVYLPPAWFKSPEPSLPVIELIAGIPGSPSDWTRAGFADSTSTDFSTHHNGMAPILVIPDNNGSVQDTECSNTTLGKAETYLTVDVINYMVSQFNAATGAQHWAIAGLSDGGVCASMLSLRNPKIYSTFADYSGFPSPTYLDDNEQQTIQTLYGGSKDDYEAHNPIHLLTDGQKYPSLAGWFSAGSSDTPSVQASQQLAAAAKDAGFRQVCLTLPPGSHNFLFWSEAFKDSLPWMSWQIGLTPKPTSVPAHCDPPIH
jgi:enterochelin esterase-like enzyme